MRTKTTMLTMKAANQSSFVFIVSFRLRVKLRRTAEALAKAVVLIVVESWHAPQLTRNSA